MNFQTLLRDAVKEEGQYQMDNAFSQAVRGFMTPAFGSLAGRSSAFKAVYKEARTVARSLFRLP
jgi:hypothetical protein